MSVDQDALLGAIQRLVADRDAGALTDEQFERLSAQLLKGMAPATNTGLPAAPAASAGSQWVAAPAPKAAPARPSSSQWSAAPQPGAGPGVAEASSATPSVAKAHPRATRWSAAPQPDAAAAAAGPAVSATPSESGRRSAATSTVADPAAPRTKWSAAPQPGAAPAGGSSWSAAPQTSVERQVEEPTPSPAAQSRAEQPRRGLVRRRGRHSISGRGKAPTAPASAGDLLPDTATSAAEVVAEAEQVIAAGPAQPMVEETVPAAMEATVNQVVLPEPQAVAAELPEPEPMAASLSAPQFDAGEPTDPVGVAAVAPPTEAAPAQPRERGLVPGSYWDLSVRVLPDLPAMAGGDLHGVRAGSYWDTSARILPSRPSDLAGGDTPGTRPGGYWDRNSIKR